MKKFYEEVSAIGSGWAEIYRHYEPDSLSIFRKDTEVYCAKNHEDAIERSRKEPCVLIIQAPRSPVLWAVPYENGERIQGGMFSGAFVYTSNNTVMKGYLHPIRLMDRIE